MFSITIRHWNAKKVLVQPYMPFPISSIYSFILNWSVMILVVLWFYQMFGQIFYTLTTKLVHYLFKLCF